MKKRIGILTGGGDCPGLNAVIRAVVKRAYQLDYEVVGVLHGWRGILELTTRPLSPRDVSGILYRGGTILGTSRTNPFKDEKSLEKFEKNLKKLNFTALVALGGEDTLGVAAKLAELGYPVVGVPKTIDNDLMGTDFTFGFDTAVMVATDAVDRLHTTAESHDRVLVCEVMGRHAGWIAAYAGLAGGADAILIPENEFTVDEVCQVIWNRHKAGIFFSIIVVSEGAKMVSNEGEGDVVLSSKKKDEFGHVQLGGIGQVLADAIEKKTGYDTRVTVLGHIQRGGKPTAADRVLATRYGLKAMECVHSKNFGKMVALQGNQIIDIPLTEVAKGTKTVNEEFKHLIDVYSWKQVY
ncbi:ATP-dependent 6-phosphofructokinase [bacterium]|nr:ATP-dependent 6-phosphofructokinase [bacterium]